MRYKLPRQNLNPNLNEIIFREIKNQKVVTQRASKIKLKEIAEISRLIQKSGLPNYLVRKKLPGGLGHGIFLHPKAKPLKRGQVIAPYSGEVTIMPQSGSSDSDYIFSLISNIRMTKKEQLLLDKGQKYHPRRLYSLDLDAEKMGNFTRFINHSEKPNIAAHLLRVPTNSYGLSPSSLEIVYIAEKTIRPGEQLLVCYEDEAKSYWGVMKIKPTPITPQTFQLDVSLKLLKLNKTCE